MGAMQRRKGAYGELEAAAELKRLFPWMDVSRSARNGVDKAEDLHHSIPNVHIEVKRCETLSLYPAMSQAIEACEGKDPMILHRRNGKKWLVIMPLDNLLSIASTICTFEEAAKRGCGSCKHAWSDDLDFPCNECKVKDGNYSKWEDGRLPFAD